MYGKVTYNMDGLPKCEICGKVFRRIGCHVRHSHNMTAREYRLKYGLDIRQSLCSIESAIKSRKAVLGNYERCITENLINKGIRFKKGHHTKKYLSEQSRIRITRQIAKTWKRPRLYDIQLVKNINYLRSIAKNQEMFDEDVLYDTLEKALRYWYRWDQKFKIISFLWGTYKNTFNVEMASRKKMTCVSLSEDNYEISSDPVYLDIDNDVIKIDLMNLTSYQRRFVELLSEGKKVREIAQILGSKPSSMKSYKSKFLMKIRDQFMEQYNRKEEIRKAKEYYRNNIVDVILEKDRLSLVYQLN